MNAEQYATWLREHGHTDIEIIDDSTITSLNGRARRCTHSWVAAPSAFGAGYWKLSH